MSTTPWDGKGERVETPEFFKFARRIIRAGRRRAVEGDVENAVAHMLRLQVIIETEIQAMVDEKRATDELSWAQLAQAATLAGMPMTKAGAQQRWGIRRVSDKYQAVSR